MKVRLFPILVLGLALLNGCTKIRWVASVGDERISQDQVQTRFKMMQFFDPSMTEKKALDQIAFYKRGLLVLKKRNISISQMELDNRLKAKKAMAKNDPNMAKFLQSFESHPELTSLYLLPELIGGKLGELCHNDSTYNQAEVEKSQSLFIEAKKNPLQLEEVAKSKGIAFMKGSFDAQKWDLKWDQGRDLASSMNVPSAPWFAQRMKNDILDKLQADQVYPEVYSLYLGFLVVRKDKSDSNNLNRFSVAMVPRKSCAEWNNSNFSGTPNMVMIPNTK